MSHDDEDSPLPSVEELEDKPPEEVLEILGKAEDAAIADHETDRLDEILNLCESLGTDDWSEQHQARFDYIEATTRFDLLQLELADRDYPWPWEIPNLERAILLYRRSLTQGVEHGLRTERICKGFTNLANVHDQVGRYIEAVERWDDALALDSGFAMARANRALGLVNYARTLHDNGHRVVFLVEACDELERALENRDLLWPDARAFFESMHEGLVDYLEGAPETDLEDWPLGETEAEVDYREWCLENVLFLNPLNDLGPYPIAAQDVLTLPTVTSEGNEGLAWHSLYNQLKQEYVSARYLYYAGIHQEEAHFSDRCVRLYNPLDYPVYGLGIEQVKLAYRAAYSIFDKIAFFLNDYLELKIPPKQVYFRSLWYQGQDRNQGLRDEFVQRPNWSLRGLFWLSKDIYTSDEEYEDALLPDARQLQDIRNHLEHKFLKLHDPIGQSVADAVRPEQLFSEDLSHSVAYPEFKDKALRLLKMARAALIYLSLGVHTEEQREGPQEDGPTVPIQLDTYEDDWKVPFD